MTVALDTLRFTQWLEQVGVHAELARDMVLADVATKDDLGTLKRKIDGSLRELERRMTIKLGAITAAAVAILAAVQKHL